MTHRADVAIVGAGIVGLAHAWAAARRGLSVVLFERDRQARGASVRNFGMVWPIGQPAGLPLEQALHSRSRWLALAEQASISVSPCGSLHLAYQPDERAVLEEFASSAPALGYDARLVAPDEALRRCSAINPSGLLGALWSSTELCVDPRQAIAALPLWLHETHGVELRFGTVVCQVEAPHLRTTDGQSWQVDRVIVCSGADFQTLFPEVFATSGIRVCKLQMMRTPPQPDGWRLGPHIAGGLTLHHYASFQHCATLARLRQRIHEELPSYVKYGIHVMAAQNHLGEVVIGDSHEHDEAIEPFDKPEIDQLILDYLRGLVRLPDWTIAARWHGQYARHPTQSLFTAEPGPGVLIHMSPGGAGMTLSFGQAEDWWATVAG